MTKAKLNGKRRFLFWLTVAAVAVAVAAFVFAGFYREYRFIEQNDSYIGGLCAVYNVEKALVYAVIKAESGFNTDARSAKGAVGLMQLMPETARFISQKNNETYFNADTLSDARTNIKYGIMYLSYLSDRFDGTCAIAAAYNAGEGNVKKWQKEREVLKLEDIEFGETRHYVKKVMGFYRAYARKFSAAA